MFGFTSSKSKWEKMASQCGDSYLREGIRTLFIPYNISPKKYAINQDCMENAHPYSSKYNRASTRTLEEWCMMPSWNRPKGFSEWFLTAFPDVAYWFQTAPEHIFEKFENLPESEIIDCYTNRFRVSFLRHLIDTYLLYTKKTLETAE